VPTLLQAGKVCAWRAGLAHLREGALETCGRLAPKLARAALGLSPAAKSLPLETVVQELRADPWLDPASLGKAPAPEKRLRVVGAVGAFRGFGGPFLRPPRVAYAEGHFLASDGERCWVLCADRFGATLHPAGADLPPDGSDSFFQIDKKGKVTRDKESQFFPELKDPSSRAGDP